MSEASYIQVLPHTSCLLGHVTAEKVGARESQIIEQELRASAPGKKWKIVLDLNEVTVLASMGLGMLVSLHKTCSQEGGRLVVCGLREDIVQVMKITHLDRILKVAKDREAGLKIVG
ncbi:MAG TPA: STAS domain-containing protein [Phycisphaerales bacterium]|nr:STAS domain-containing protein [Phycisphaerales bacterium]